MTAARNFPNPEATHQVGSPDAVIYKFPSQGEAMGVRAESPNTLALGNLATHSSRPLATEPGDPFFTLTHKMGPAGFDGQFVQFDPITGRQITPDQK